MNRDNKTRNIREVKKKTKYEDSIDGIVWNLVGRVNVLEDKVNVLDKGTMNPERLGGVVDSEEVEEEKLTFNELTVLKSFTTTELDRWTHIPNAEPKRSYLSGIVGKLNKMLKEKDETAKA